MVFCAARNGRWLVHPVRKQRLMIVAFILVFASLAAGLVSYALRGNINLFFPPADIVAGKAPLGQSIRIGGMVVEGSVQRSPDSLEVRFDVTDYKATVTAVYVGILPDLFAEGQGIVASPWPIARGALASILSGTCLSPATGRSCASGLFPRLAWASTDDVFVSEISAGLATAR